MCGATSTLLSNLARTDFNMMNATGNSLVELWLGPVTRQDVSVTVVCLMSYKARYTTSHTQQQPRAFDDMHTQGQGGKDDKTVCHAQGKEVTATGAV